MSWVGHILDALGHKESMRYEFLRQIKKEAISNN